MRSPTLNVVPDIAQQFSVELLLTIFERMCLVRYFESGVIDAVDKNEITCPVYLCSGQEAVAAALSTEVRDYLVFAQHRAHDIYLTFGGPPERLRDELLGLRTGTSQGKAGSNCLQYHGDGISMFGHHGLIGENVPQAVGAALGSGKNTVCIFGDGAAEEDYVFAAMGFAVTHKLPVLFVCIDNNLSILTTIDIRRSWSITEVARTLDMHAIDVADDPWTVVHYTRELTKDLPAFINCHVCRGYWHAGIGIDGPPEWDRYEMVENELGRLGHKGAVQEIKEKTRRSAEKLWKRELSLKPLEK
jgi:pyruvate dehydrogenase E1 component alpha subunit